MYYLNVVKLRFDIFKAGNYQAHKLREDTTIYTFTNNDVMAVLSTCNESIIKGIERGFKQNDMYFDITVPGSPHMEYMMPYIVATSLAELILKRSNINAIRTTSGEIEGGKV